MGWIMDNCPISIIHYSLFIIHYWWGGVFQKKLDKILTFIYLTS